ncbi:DNA repair protein complementing XP-G cells homolog [Eurytemora carolleeae]|uniref:DNA repair protein complementing XP-G cells homolog n=1 Tax=Eurytemora carolleeae TaxID=1294199 RepID=UPI000C785E08|nr:DNA repair protein complementing XP-G cells homolog [Eurytemora carolleeae]|eukprot:XP_023346371.1 DNA repair protein complementing XP-G cells homolog [Eurytemora affinis]
MKKYVFVFCFFSHFLSFRLRMGVLGLWNLLEPVGKPVPIESLENKILAVDISIWLNQAVKGFRDRTGNAVPHGHLLGLYHRVCKLLFYRIKPVFVFDGQPPQLKRDTLIRRRMRKSKVSRKANAASAKILENYLKSQAIAQKLKRQTYAIEKVAKKGTEGIHNILSETLKTVDKEDKCQSD